MPPFLTRRVIRRILTEQSWLPPHRAIHRRRLHHNTWSRRAITQPVSRQQIRTAFGIGGSQELKTKQVDHEPGMPIIYTHAEDIRQGYRRHTPQELVKAINMLFASKAKTKRPMVDHQVACLVAVFKHLIGPDGANQRLEGINLENIDTAMQALPENCTMSHVEMVEIMLEVVKCRQELGEAGPKVNPYAGVEVYVKALSRCGRSTEAREYLVELLGTCEGDLGRRCCLHILHGFRRESKTDELGPTAELTAGPQGRMAGRARLLVMEFYADQGDAEQLKNWFDRPADTPPSIILKSYMVLILFAVQHSQMPWLDSIFKPILEREDLDPPTFTALYAWAAARSKSVTDVERMVEIMERRYPDEEAAIPSVSTINQMLRVALARKDPYLAERYIDLARKLSLEPDLDTHAQQLRYRLAAQDLDGAWQSYNQLLSCQDYPPSRQTLASIFGELATAILADEPPKLDRLESLLAECEEQDLRLPPLAVRPLALHFLASNQSLRATNLFNSHLPHFNARDRPPLIDALTSVILDPETRLRPFWDGYQLLRTHFPELALPVRISIMDSCFARQRSDMATLVLSHSRTHPDPALRPSLEFYIRCILGLGRSGDAQHLLAVHNLLKLDTRHAGTLTTRAYNALMLAHIGTDEPGRALDFWEVIERSVEGPSYSSIRIFFRAMQRYAFGGREAAALWRRLAEMGVLVEVEVGREYAGVCAAHGDWEGFGEVVGEMEREWERERGGEGEGKGEEGRPVDVVTVQRWYNCAWYSEHHVQFAEWMVKRYPDVWEEARKSRVKETVMGKSFELEDDLEP